MPQRRATIRQSIRPRRCGHDARCGHRHARGPARVIDELGDGLLRPVLRLLLYFVVDVLYHLVCHFTGWVVLRAITVGRWPPHALFDTRDSAMTEFVGIVILVALGVWILI